MCIAMNIYMKYACYDIIVKKMCYAILIAHRHGRIERNRLWALSRFRHWAAAQLSMAHRWLMSAQCSITIVWLVFAQCYTIFHSNLIEQKYMSIFKKIRKAISWAVSHSNFCSIAVNQKHYKFNGVGNKYRL